MSSDLEASQAERPKPTDLGDLSPQEFRRAAHRVADLLADYLENVGQYPVVPKIQPGDVRENLPFRLRRNAWGRSVAGTSSRTDFPEPTASFGLAGTLAQQQR